MSHFQWLVAIASGLAAGNYNKESSGGKQSSMMLFLWGQGAVLVNNFGIPVEFGFCTLRKRCAGIKEKAKKAESSAKTESKKTGKKGK